MVRSVTACGMVGLLLCTFVFPVFGGDDAGDAGRLREEKTRQIEQAVPGHAEQIAAIEAASVPPLDRTPMRDAVITAVGDWNPQKGFPRLASRRDIVLPLAVVALEDESLGEERVVYLEMLSLHFWSYGDQPHDPWLLGRVTDALVDSYRKGDAAWRERILEVLRSYLDEEDILQRIGEEPGKSSTGP